MYGVIKTAFNVTFFADLTACAFCTFRWLWICIRHRENLRARKDYSRAAFIFGAVSGLAMAASFAAAVVQYGGIG